MPLISVHGVVGGTVGSVMDSSPLLHLTRRLLAVNGLSGIMWIDEWRA